MNSSSLLQSASRLAIIVLLAAFLSPALAQPLFNHFKTLSAQGTIPPDFTTTTGEKIEQDIATGRTNLPPMKERIFLEGIHRSIDQILHSGSVIYGDEVTLYIRAVAENLLKNDPELLGKLRFYTIKSNATNAFSTDQGIVFVTTGLISQLTSEAQLAYVLSHEISHYTEHHVVEAFDWKMKTRYQHDRIRQLSIYSKEHEFSADKLALDLYNAAGYSEDEIISTFDVLMYSYLPFDEVEIPNSYFSSTHLYVPDAVFPTKKYPIKAEEDYNDENSSHPNIKKRKDAALNASKKYASWGDVIFSQGESTFYYIRNLARFESVRTDIINANFADALYSIFLLEKEFPQSAYLKQMKAIAWLGMAQFKEANQQSKTMPSTSDYEGESAKMYGFLKKLNDDGMMTMALRNIYDIYKEMPEDQVTKGVMDRMIKTLAESDHFDWSNYSSKDFHESARQALAKSDTAAKADETKKPDAAKSKYDKIKTKKNANAPESFDSLKFYVYGISDILKDSALRSAYQSYHEPWLEKKAAKEAYRKLSNKEKYEYDKQHKTNKRTSDLAIGMEQCILVQPTVTDYQNGSVNWERSEKRRLDLTEAIAESSLMCDVEVSQLDHDDIILNGTASFNERNVLYSLLEQTANHEGVDFFPVDYVALKDIENTYGTSNLMYTLVDHYYDPEISWAVIGYSAVLFPTLPFTMLIYVPIQLIKGHHTEITVLVIDAVTGRMKASTQTETRTRPLRQYLGAHYYDIFQQLKSTPNS